MLLHGRSWLGNFLFEIRNRLCYLKGIFSEINKAGPDFSGDVRALATKWEPTVDELLALQSRMTPLVRFEQKEELDWESLILEVGTGLRRLSGLKDDASKLAPTSGRVDPWLSVNTIRSLIEGLLECQQMIERQEYRKELEEMFRSKAPGAS